ncbi:MAG: hypothetical protein AAF806_03935 [Bacteroidota bacterium]
MAREKLKVYTDEVERFMQSYWDGLCEKDQRRYLAVEAKKIGYGGISYIANLFGVTRNRVYHGIQELENPEMLDEIPEGKQRRKGAGAPKKKTTKLN